MLQINYIFADTNQAHITSTSMLRVLLIIALSSIMSVSYAVSFNTAFKYRLQTITVNDGLSQHDISSITQDRYGFIWIATYDGLLRYDGYTFRKFRFNYEDPASIRDNRILSVFIDSKGRLWISTEGGGVNLYNYELESFESFLLGTTPMDNNVYTIYEDENENLWFGTNGGVYVLRFCDKSKSAETIRIISGLTEIDNVFSILTDYKKDVFLGTYEGLFQMSYKGNNGSLEYHEPVPFPRFPEGMVYALKKLDSYNTFVGGEAGLFIFNHTTRQFKEITFENRPLLFVRSINKINENTYAIGTEKSGIFELTVRQNEFILSRILIDKVNYLEKSLIKTLFIDNNQNMWIGTGNNGVGRINLHAPRFYRLFNSNDDTGNFVRYFWKDKNERLWIQIKNEDFVCYEKGSKRSLIPFSTRMINSISEDKNGNIWASSIDEIYFFNLEKNNYKPQKIIDSKSFPDEIRNKISVIRSVKEDGYGNIWAGCWNGILLIKNYRKPNTTYHFYQDFDTPFNHISVHSLYVDNTGKNIWACSRDYGLFKLIIDKEGNILNRKRFHNSGIKGKQLNSNHVWSVYKSNNGTVWVGTDSGLNSITMNGDDYQIESIEALRSFKIQTIIEDDNNQLWLNSSMGLLCYNISDKSLKRYTYSDGLSNTALSDCAQIDENGFIYISTINGITFFKPQEIIQNPYKPEVLFTGFNIFNKEVKVGEKINGRIILEKSLTSKPTIRLKHNENNFTIQYVGLHFANPAENKFQHKLIGYNNEWTHNSPGNRSASYNNLPIGTYKFYVKSANSDGIWSDETLLAEIEILPAPWVTWWAWTIYALMISALVYLIFSYYKRQENLKRSLWKEQLERHHDKELNDARLQFHTNITHEIRTPLTLITAPLHEIMSHPIEDEFITKRIRYIHNNTRRLSRLVNQFLDLRKIDKESMPLCVKEVNIDKLFEDVIDGFKHLIDQKNISLEIVRDMSITNGHLDEDKLNKIISNLLSNAIKYTGIKGNIKIYIHCNEDKLKFTIEDDGVGIHLTELSKIFERFYQAENSQGGGTGIGLALVKELVRLHYGEVFARSEPGNGSAFTVEIPVNQNFYAPNEISKDKANESEEEVITEEMTPSEKGIILIVEDDNDMRDYLSSVLMPYFDIILESNAVSGYEKATEKVPDLIITDWMMPLMSGIEFCEKLKNNFHTSHIPVIILTAKTRPEDMITGYGAGAEMYLTKPFVPEQLILQINNMIAYRKPVLDVKRITEEPPGSSPVNEREQKFIIKLNKCIEEHLEDTEYSIEDICREIGTSRMQLHRKLTAIVGESASDYIRNFKMMRAKEFLESGEYNVSEVVYKVGFKSNSHFTKTYKKTFGHAPSEVLHN